MAEKGLVIKVVQDLISPFAHLNHVVYADNFYSSGPLVKWLAGREIYYAGTIKRNACGFPECLKDVEPQKGSYVVKKVEEKEGDKVVGETCYYVFNDRKVVSLVTNVFLNIWRVKCPGYSGTVSLGISLSPQSCQRTISLWEVLTVLVKLEEPMGMIRSPKGIGCAHSFSFSTMQSIMLLFCTNTTAHIIN